MKADPAQTEADEGQPQACSTCGREAVLVMDATGWCESCLHARGSCCADPETGEG